MIELSQPIGIQGNKSQKHIKYNINKIISLPKDQIQWCLFIADLDVILVQNTIFKNKSEKIGNHKNTIKCVNNVKINLPFHI